MAKRVDVLIIGGGCIGVCCAYFLAEKGREVTLVEQGEVGTGCSYGNAGVISRSHIVPLPAPGVLIKAAKWLLDPESPLYIKPRLSLPLLSWLIRFSLACRKGPMLNAMGLLSELIQSSLALYEEFARQGGLNFHFSRNGSLAIYKSSDGFKAGIREAELIKPYGIESEVLDQTAVRELEPKIQPQIAGGIYLSPDAHLNPAEFVRWLAARSQSKGVTFLTSTEVLFLETSRNRIFKTGTTRGDFEANQVVLAAGSWSARLAAQLRLVLPIQPAKGYSITVKRQEGDFSIPVWLSESKVVATPMGKVLRFAGTLELVDLDYSVNRRRLNAIRRAAREYLIGADDYEVLEIWRGLRPMMPDGLPVIGVSEMWENLIIATGHGMQGMTLGPITGKVVAQLMCREPPVVDVSRLGAHRF
jgi:D-amino-acid dehydrogenase